MPVDDDDFVPGGDEPSLPVDDLGTGIFAPREGFKPLVTEDDSANRKPDNGLAGELAELRAQRQELLARLNSQDSEKQAIAAQLAQLNLKLENGANTPKKTGWDSYTRDDLQRIIFEQSAALTADPNEVDQDGNRVKSKFDPNVFAKAQVELANRIADERMKQMMDSYTNTELVKGQYSEIRAQIVDDFGAAFCKKGTPEFDAAQKHYREIVAKYGKQTAMAIPDFEYQACMLAARELGRFNTRGTMPKPGSPTATSTGPRMPMGSPRRESQVTSRREMAAKALRAGDLQGFAKTVAGSMFNIE